MAWGFAEVLPDRVTVLAETVERADEIDVARAQQSLRDAEQSLQSAHTEEEFARAGDKIRRAEARLDVAREKSS